MHVYIFQRFAWGLAWGLSLKYEEQSEMWAALGCVVTVVGTLFWLLWKR